MSGVGGASALLMLSSLSAAEIISAVNTANVAMLKSIKGIGDKTAQRIVVLGSFHTVGPVLTMQPWLTTPSSET